MDIKELNTRIALKYDTYANWAKEDKANEGANLVLLPGEIGICEVGVVSSESQVAPTVLFKVGGSKYPEGHEKAGQLMAFKDLPWASAKAADVYDWAKSETVVLDGSTIKFKTGDTVNHFIDLSKLNFATQTTTNDLSARLADVEAALGIDGEGSADSVSSQIAGLDERLDAIEGDGEKSIKKAAENALTSAKAYTDTEVAKDRERLTSLETTVGTHTTSIDTNTSDIAKLKTDLASEVSNRTSAVGDLDTAYKAADKAINDKIGGSFDSTNTVAKAIEEAKTAGTTAQNQVSALENGAVKTNATKIETNASNIATLRTDLDTEVTNRTNADNALDTRLTKVEAFFVGAAEDEGEGESLKNALDTLVEIQNYINTDGSAADEMVKDIQANAQAIATIQNIVKDGGTLEARVDQTESDITAIEGRADTLEAITAGYDATNTIQKVISAVDTKAANAASAAATADGKAVTAQNTANDVKSAIENTTTGLAATKKIADDAAAAVSALDTRVGTAESNITTLQGIVSTGADSNTNLRTDIKALQDLTGDASKGNVQLRDELTALQGVVNHAETGLAKTKSIADGAATLAGTNSSKIAAIEADYLKAADGYIFNCGSASTVIHTI